MQPTRKVNLTIEIPKDDLETSIVWHDTSTTEPLPPAFNKRLSQDQKAAIIQQLEELAQRIINHRSSDE